MKIFFILGPADGENSVQWHGNSEIMMEEQTCLNALVKSEFILF